MGLYDEAMRAYDGEDRHSEGVLAVVNLVWTEATRRTADLEQDRNRLVAEKGDLTAVIKGQAREILELRGADGPARTPQQERATAAARQCGCGQPEAHEG